MAYGLLRENAAVLLYSKELLTFISDYPTLPLGQLKALGAFLVSPAIINARPEQVAFVKREFLRCGVFTTLSAEKFDWVIGAIDTELLLRPEILVVITILLPREFLPLT